MMKIDLNGEGWRLRESGASQVYHCTVPCSVLSVLMQEEVIGNPDQNENMEIANSYLDRNYELEYVLTVTGDLMKEDCVELVMSGVDTVADVYLNDQRVIRLKNVHRTYRVPVKEYLCMGANDLKIIFISPIQEVEKREVNEKKNVRYYHEGSTYGSQILRKAHASFGWDFAPVLPDMGIIRSISIDAYTGPRLEEVHFFQEHDNGNVTLYVDPIIRYSQIVPVEIEIEVEGQERIRLNAIPPVAGTSRTPQGKNEIAFPISDPRLWWPNGLGDPNLYEVRVKLYKDGKVYDEKEYHIGLRTIQLSREEDQWGEEFAFVVNGIKIYTMGANYVPQDTIAARITSERIKELVESARLANYNCLRVWGGGYYPSDEFYDLCDRAGIMVWQDLMFAENAYDLTPGFEKNIVAEVRENVARLRHHACLALWCGNSRMEAAWSRGGILENDSPLLKTDYIKMFEYILPATVSEEDEQTAYWPSTPSSGGSLDAPEDENRGDSHIWQVWHGREPVSSYENHTPRFLTEFGVQSLPSLKTIKEFAPEEEWNLFSPVMEAHQKDEGGNRKLLEYLAGDFRYPKDFGSLVYVSQIFQAEAFRKAAEQCRRNRGRCMGTLFWQMNDIWPGISWSAVDYFGRWKAMQYVAKRTYAPCTGGVCIDGMSAIPWLVNDGMEDITVKLRMTVFTVEGKTVQMYNEEGIARAGDVKRFVRRDIKRSLMNVNLRNLYLLAEFETEFGRYENCTFFVPYKHLNLPKAEIQVEIEDAGADYLIHLSSETLALFVTLELKESDCIFSDNVFHLHKGAVKTVSINKESIRSKKLVTPSVLKEELVIRHLRDSYV